MIDMNKSHVYNLYTDFFNLFYMISLDDVFSYVRPRSILFTILFEEQHFTCFNLAALKVDIPTFQKFNMHLHLNTTILCFFYIKQVAAFTQYYSDNFINGSNLGWGIIHSKRDLSSTLKPYRIQLRHVRLHITNSQHLSRM